MRLRDIDETMVYAEHSSEYKKLELAAALMSFLSPNKKRYHVHNVWMDVDEGIAWTTIVGESGLKTFPEYQVLTKDEQEEILEKKSVKDILDVVERFLAVNNGVAK